MKRALENTPEVNKIIYRLFVYPFILIIAWIPPTLIKFVSMSDETTYILLMMTMSLTHSQGLLNSLYYGSNKMEEFRSCWGIIFGARSHDVGMVQRDKLKEYLGSDYTVSNESLTKYATDEY